MPAPESEREIFHEGSIGAACHRRFPVPAPDHGPFGDWYARLIYEVPALRTFTEGMNGGPLVRQLKDHFEAVPPPVDSLTKDNALFLIANLQGEIIRRPFLRHRLVQKLKAVPEMKARTPGEKDFVDKLCHFFPMAGWLNKRLLGRLSLSETEMSHLLGNSLDEMITQSLGSASKCLAFALGITAAVTKIGNSERINLSSLVREDCECIQRRCSTEGVKDPFFATPGHGFDHHFHLGNLIDINLRRVLDDSLVRRFSPVSLIHVEDEPLWVAWAEELKRRGYIAPNDEGSRVFSSGEDAIDEIRSRIASLTPLPDAILTDIDLGSGSGSISGLGLCGLIAKECKKARMRIPYIMVYSSDIEGNIGELCLLQEQGIVRKGWDKGNFSPLDFMQTLTGDLG